MIESNMNISSSPTQQPENPQSQLYFKASNVPNEQTAGKCTDFQNPTNPLYFQQLMSQQRAAMNNLANMHPSNQGFSSTTPQLFGSQKFNNQMYFGGCDPRTLSNFPFQNGYNQNFGVPSFGFPSSAGMYQPNNQCFNEKDNLSYQQLNQLSFQERQQMSLFHNNCSLQNLQQQLHPLASTNHYCFPVNETQKCIHEIKAEEYHTIPRDKESFQSQKLDGQTQNSIENSSITCNNTNKDEKINQITPSSEKIKNFTLPLLPSCQRHSSKKDTTLKYMCNSENCSMKLKLLCYNCVKEHQQSHEIMEVQNFFNSAKNKIESQSPLKNVDSNDKQLELNITGLKRMRESADSLLELSQSLQRAFQVMKLSCKEEQSSFCEILNEIESSEFLSEKQMNDKIAELALNSQRLFQEKKDGINQFEQINETMSNMIKEAEQMSSTIHSGVSRLLKNVQKCFLGSEMKDIEKRHQEEKILDHFSKLFHLIKGHAKKRDVINFLTWEPLSKELKYSKDIKDKHGEHFYVSFSLKLKNIENMDAKEIDEDFIGKIVSVVEEKAPEIQNKKNFERKKIDPNGKKRKYCRFNPHIEIDVSMNSSAYKNIKIE